MKGSARTSVSVRGGSGHYESIGDAVTAALLPSSTIRACTSTFNPNRPAWISMISCDEFMKQKEFYLAHPTP